MNQDMIHQNYQQRETHRALRSLSAIGLAVAVCLALPQAICQADEISPSLKVSVSAEQVLVAEPFTYRLVVTVPKGTRVFLPQVSETLGDFDVISQQQWEDVPDQDQQRIWTQELILESIDTGELEIPEIEVRCQRNRESTIIRSKPVSIQVASVLEGRPDPKSLRDIHSVIDVEPTPKPKATSSWMLYAVGGGLLIAISAAAILVFQRKKTIVPEAWAKRELAELQTAFSGGEYGSAEVANRLSGIVRQYLEYQFELDASKRSTGELGNLIAERALISDSVTQRLIALLESMDLAMFAGLVLSSTELNEAIATAHELVDEINAEPQALSGRRETS